MTTQNSEKQPRKQPVGKPFQKGDARINRGGRPGDYGEFRALCRSKSPESVAALVDALGEGGAPAVAAARVLLEYGWGKPASAPEDLDAVREGGGNVLGVLTQEQLMEIARGKP
jgi:hypothetical protein